jgi:hypothetical protein
MKVPAFTVSRLLPQRLDGGAPANDLNSNFARAIE